jgi:F0F1-type ATP synthase membrane subunit c/vacuolar-type H+-ATPase subunit K
MSGPNPNVDPEARLRLMRILWAVFLMTVGLYATVAYFVRPSGESSVRAAESLGGGAAEAGGFSVLLLAFFALGLSTVVASFLVKQAYAKRAVREQSTAHLQTGLIIALALCESAGLFGFVGLFADGNPFAYLLFVISAAGIVLHFPRREDVIAASGGGTGFGVGIN